MNQTHNFYNNITFMRADLTFNYFDEKTAIFMLKNKHRYFEHLQHKTFHL